MRRTLRWRGIREAVYCLLHDGERLPHPSLPPFSYPRRVRRRRILLRDWVRVGRTASRTSSRDGLLWSATAVPLERGKESRRRSQPEPPFHPLQPTVQRRVHPHAHVVPVRRCRVVGQRVPDCLDQPRGHATARRRAISKRARIAASSAVGTSCVDDASRRGQHGAAEASENMDSSEGGGAVRVASPPASSSGRVVPGRILTHATPASDSMPLMNSRVGPRRGRVHTDWPRFSASRTSSVRGSGPGK